MEQVAESLAATVDEETMWQAVLNRDTRFDGVFYYAVQSTGVYCRPGCPARRPRREQVTFFSSCEAAEKAGYRACKRCRPQEAMELSTRVELVERACRLIETAVDAPPSLEELGKALSISPFHLHRLFKSVTGLTPYQYAAGHKLKKFKERVKQGDDLTTALYEAGYGSSSRLYENAASRLGMTPASYQRGGQGKQIVYVIVDTPLGKMLVAATPQGICSVCFGVDHAQLLGRLKNEYPAAEIQHNDQALTEWVTALLQNLAGNQPHLALPLDLQATAFQLRVWEELRRIPYGETRTYTEVACAIGKPKAVRAVANACGANPTVLVTPCHRVVRSDGTLGGYRYGVERKQALLEKEKASRSE
jgi:AraC family transcriptional regulator, regulatory protein of adaptative response / methylated-DNA-[protein]-cysteine methyltransferase